MLNLLRMDLYRLLKCKYIYICFAVLVFVNLTCYGMVFLIGTQQGREAAANMGLELLVEGETEDLLAGQDSLLMYRESYMDGGVYALVFGIITTVFLCVDFQSGFVKNILTQHRARWKYIGSKLAAMGILNVVYLALGLFINGLINRLFGTLVPFAPAGSQAFYLAWAWLASMAFAALVTMISVFTRSTAVGVLAAVFFSSGLVVLPLYSLTNLFGMGGWLPYTLYYNLAYGPSAYTSPGDLKVFAIAFAFLAVYTTTAAISLTKQDI